MLFFIVNELTCDIIRLPHEERVDHDHESQIHDIIKQINKLIREQSASGQRKKQLTIF